MKYYFLDISTPHGEERHIAIRHEDGGMMSFPLTDDNPNKPAYDAWVAEGNVAEEWNPNGN